MADDGIREHHGMRCLNNKGQPVSVIVQEMSNGTIAIDGCYETRVMTMREARYLASKLYRLARRIRDRESPEA